MCILLANWRIGRDFPYAVVGKMASTLAVYTFRKNRPNPHRGTLLRRLPPREWYTGDSCLVVHIFLGHFVEFTAQYACFLAARR